MNPLIYVGFELINEFDGILKQKLMVQFSYIKLNSVKVIRHEKKNILYFQNLIDIHISVCMFLLLIDVKQNSIHVYFKVYTI